MADKCDDCERLYRKAILMCLLTTTLLLAWLILFSIHEAEQQDAVNSLQICNANLTNATEVTGVNGVWFSPGYYCVWAADRSFQDINDTATHEKCHGLIQEDPFHFCSSYCTCAIKT
jgi:hypothetical protein